MNKKPVIIPYDGFEDANKLLQEVEEDLQDLGILEVLSFIKVNDAVFMPPLSAVDWITDLFEIINRYTRHLDVGIFFDLKLADTSGTLKNIATHFGSC